MAGASAGFVCIAILHFFLLSALPGVQCGEDNDPDWYSRSADMINGKQPKDIYTRGHAHAYLGIPYAMPSNGSNAFKLPKDINPYRDYTDVNLDFGPYCPQMVEVPGMPDRNFFIGQQDCLTLNLIHPVPPNPTRKYPVYVVLHPGWLLRGTARDFGIQGIVHNLVTRGIVVVTVEYRLGPYGLFKFGTGAEGDSLRSIYDVIAALRWVNKYIHDFAGNESAVTLGGWGDGGACLASWLVIAATNTSNGISHLFEQADIHGGSAQLCWLHFYSDAGRKMDNASQMVAKDLCPGKRVDSLRKCMEQRCACAADISKEVCEKKTRQCTEAAWAAAQKLSLPLAQMEEPDGDMFSLPPYSASFRNAYIHQSQRHTMRILMGWTRDEYAAIQPSTRAKRYNKEYLRSEFFRLAHLTHTNTNITNAFEGIVNYYLTLYYPMLDKTTMRESEWYRLYIRFMSDYLFRDIGCEDAFFWAFDGHSVLLYQFDAEPSVSFTPVVDASAARKFNASPVGHLADLPYVFMAEQYFKPGEHNIAGALDKQPLLGEWNLANVMGRMMADFVWQRPAEPYFRPLESCRLSPGDVHIVYTPWVSHISRSDGIDRPVVTSIPIDLFNTWGSFINKYFLGDVDSSVPPNPIYPDHGDLPCPRVDATNVTGPP